MVGPIKCGVVLLFQCCYLLRGQACFRYLGEVCKLSQEGRIESFALPNLRLKSCRKPPNIPMDRTKRMVPLITSDCSKPQHRALLRGIWEGQRNHLRPF